MITAIPLLLMAYWLVFGLGALWRSAIEAEGGAAIREIQAELGGVLSPTWLGYRLQLDHVRIDWRGGLFGAHTRVRRDSGTITRTGLLDLAAILCLFDAD